MDIGQILAKDIDRKLDGVVKASNSAQLEAEVNEYVITAEVAKHLGKLLDTYTQPGEPESNGVWISGFFGSGKSHLLKMLAYLLGDVDGGGIDRADVVSVFLDKLPAGDALLKGALTRSASIPARSLLFNIDEKVDKHEKNQPDALLKVFVQVFYEACGFFGKSPYIARFERDLTSQGHYQEFTEAFTRYYGKPWEQGRELAVLVEPHVEKAYAEVIGTSLDKPLTAYRQNYSVSIESFADEVGAWLEQQEPSMRLNFFVDEVGQFIGQNGQLLLSLQTIAESLFTRCRGRSWVMVTSQEVLESIIGDRTKQQQMDFSKAEARFKPRLNLDSKNVREVVSKRLLEKTTDGATQLESIYSSNADRFRSLFAFRDQRTYQNYATVEDFIGIYPFVDYQFELFHAAMKGLSDYNAFTGRHASVGERSLLGVTKEIGSAMKNAEVGSLATLDMFYDGIEKSVLSDVKRNIGVADEHLTGPDKPLAVRVLKALLMTKYDDQFEATPQALAVLLTDSVNTNVAALREQVERALQLLVTNTYVQRTGSSYSYLTNEEQDVEKAIKAVDRNDAAIKKLLNEEVVQASGVGAKVRHDKTGADLGLERWLDGERQGRSEPLGVHFVTPLGGYSLEQVQFQSVGAAGTVFVVLDLDQRTLDEIDLFVRTQDYVRLQLNSTLPESRRRILESHQRHNQDRRRELMKVLREAVTQATLVHNGSSLTISAGDAKERVHAALQVAIEAKYTRINEVRSIASVKDTDLAAILRDENTFDLEVTSTLDTLAQAVLAALRQAKVRQVNSSVGSLVEEFAAPPYGWKLTSVLAAIAHAVKTGRVRLKLDSRTLVRTEIAAELRNTAKHRQILVEEVREQDPAKMKKLQSFLTGYRDTGAAPTSAEELVAQVRTALSESLVEVTGWTSLGYPFGPDAERAAAKIRTAAEGHSDDWYFDDFLTTCDELLDLKDDFLTPVRAFLSGSQRTIVDEARAFLQRRGAELATIDPEAAEALRRNLDSPIFFRGTTIPQIKQEHLRLLERLDETVTTRRGALRSEVEQQLQELLAEQMFTAATPSAQEQVRAGYQSLLGEVDRAATLGQVALAKSNLDRQHESAVTTLTTTGGEPAKTVRLTALCVEGVPAMLTRDEIEPYLSGLRSRLLAELDEGKTIIR
jgi:hypothetical protein